MRTVWKDKSGNCKCESCGKIVTEAELNWDKDLGYCEDCYREIKEHDNPESQLSSCSAIGIESSIKSVIGTDSTRESATSSMSVTNRSPFSMRRIK